MNNKAISHRLRQAGFTLVEVLVALIIGMLVALAAMASMLGTRSTAMTGDDVNALHQSSALAFRLLGQQIRQAGYFPIDATGPLYYFDVNANPKLANEPAFFAIKGQEAAAGSVNDTLKVGFAPNPDYFHDCLGQVAKNSAGAAYSPGNPADPANVRLITSEFYVVNGALRCKGSGHTTPQPIIDGVERFDVMYGIGDAGTERVVRYVTATNVASFDQVRTVRVCLQLAGISRSNPGGSYVDCDGSSQTSSDGRLRRVYTAVFALRNL
ncbi:putative Tfp pilus assembly protein PilW [Variovorax paradoxus B4]|uniref:Putative Tfp pilus assembly protein PilW n=1 Tax=Variovorax paradoxus B4 TaxID=1246301 RepID=T1XDN7_VARPD|nr:PilW family protein [Variovorax paradoxus]AGU50260.1 putative Tfp pilus assembly protein PilW [Variovorax paradoxus B4]